MSLTRFTSLIIMIFGMVMFMLTPLEGELKKSIKKILLAVLGGIMFRIYQTIIIMIQKKTY